LARDDLIQATGTVEKILGGGRYQITLESGQTVTAQLSGRMRRFRIRVIPGDRVQVGLSPYAGATRVLGAASRRAAGA
jgi:translation initiation factor IF-1